MIEQYALYLGKSQVGKVQVLHHGLYYRFICHCKLKSSSIWRLYVTCADHKEKLGVLIPEEDGFGLETKIPRKRIGEGPMEFSLLPNHDSFTRFIPIYPQEPFEYIENLKDGFLSIKDGQPGLVLTK